MVANFLGRRQTNISSAAAIISLMIAFSRILGLMRNRVLAHFFSSTELSLYFAAFRLPGAVFDILVFGVISAAFIPTFTAYLAKDEEKQAWQIANGVLILALLVFLVLSGLIFLLAAPLYRRIIPGFSQEQIDQVVFLARILIVSQGFFLLSYFLTGILESWQRFLVPAIAPIFYNLGIIGGTAFLAPKLGLTGSVLGVVAGAFFHFIIQLPLAFNLGFRPRLIFNFSQPGLKKVGRLAWPRIIELSLLELAKTIELFFASLVSVGAYTWLTFANSLQLLPVDLFGTSLAKATLPTFSSLAAREENDQFKKVFLSSWQQILFLTLPASVFLVVLRVPIVRLVFGAARFTWESTLETGYTLSVFCLAIFSQALVLLLNRAFYAFQETKTAVKVSVFSTLINIILSGLLILILKFPLWGLALSFTLASLLQFLILFRLLANKLGGFSKEETLTPFLKTALAAVVAGGLMFFLLKIFDRSVWDKRLSFLNFFGLRLSTSLEKFVLDTRYTTNLILLTALVALAGAGAYLGLAWVLKIKALMVFLKTDYRLAGRNFFKEPDREIITATPKEGSEPLV